MKKTAFILTGLIISVSLTACKEQPASSETPVSVSESSILASVEESSEDIFYEPVPDPETTEPSEEDSDTEVFIPPKETTISDYQSIVVNNKCVLLKYTGTEKRVIVPSCVTVEGKDYEIEIGQGCFKDTDITSLSLPEYTTEIPDSMCENCKMLDTVTFNNVASIGKMAFYKCESLKIRFSDLNSADQTVIKKIGERAFSFSGLYGKIFVKKDPELEEGAFQGCKHLQEVEFESGITEIPHRVFAENSALEKITLPDTVIKIGKTAFSRSIVSSITIPKSVTEIGEYFISTYSEGFVIYTGAILGYKGSAAETYAKENDIVFYPLD